MRARRLVSLLAAAAATAAALVATPTPAHAESNGGVRILPLGDSITDGSNVPGAEPGPAEGLRA